MKKIFYILLFIVGSASLLKAQCYGTVQFDNSVNANGASTFNITTANPNEMILISYNGWPSPGNGPVTVDGNPATHIATAFDNNNSGIAEVYCYSAPLAGSHTINCIEPNYSSPYYLNMAASFYATGTCTPLSCTSLYDTTATITCITGGSISASITTTIPNSMIYCDAENNNGETTSYPFSWTAATFLQDLHIGNGIQSSEAYTNAATPATYTIKASNLAPPSNGCGGLALILVAIQPPPCGGSLTLTTTQVDPTCGNNNGSITVTPGGGTGPYTYTWAPSGGTNATASNLSVGTYTVSVKDANGCFSTDSVTLVNAGINVTVTATGNAKCKGDSAGSAQVTVSGGAAPYTYVWSPGGGTNSNITGLSAGTYTVNITDANGCVGIGNVTITQPTALTATTNVINNVSCNGGSDGGVSATGSGGTPAYSYLWNNGQTKSNATGLSTGTYTVTVTDANGCSTIDSVTITEPVAMNLTMSYVTAHCGQSDGGADVIVTGGTPGYKYFWAPSGGTNANATGLSAATYTVSVTDAHGCKSTASVSVPDTAGETVSITAVANVTCPGGSNGSLTVTATGGTSPYTYSWSPSGGTNATASNLSAGTYTVTVKDAAGCTVTASSVLSQPPPFKDTVMSAQTICIGQSATLTDSVSGGTPGYNYSWSNGATTSTITVSPVTTTTYSVTVTDVNGCTKGPVTVKVIVRPPLNLVMGPSQAMCPGGTAAISATASGGDGNYTYTWYPGGTKSQSINVSPATTTVYTVVVNDGCGTPDDTGYVKVIIDPLPVVKFSADTLSGCAPFMCTTFADMTTIASGNLTSWVWNFGDGNTDSTQNPSHCYPNPGSYNVSLTVTSDSGCSATLSVPAMITVYSPPVANFSLSPQPVTIMSPTIEFTDMSTDNYGIASWLWNFGDFTDSTSTYQYPRYTYKDTGTYCVTLRVTNIHGCSDSTVHCLIISPQYTLYIPDAFSPNGDGRNDIFQPEGSAITQYNLYIFDRWGNLIFHSTDLYKGWNGAVHNGSKVCQQDTYVYLVQITDNLGKKHSYIGKVTLIR